MKREAIVSFLLVLLFLVSVFPMRTFSGAVNSQGGSGFFGAQSTVDPIDSWPMFHHDLNHTGNSTSVVHEYIESLWNYTTGGEVGCSPAVVNGKVFVGSGNGSVYALNASASNPLPVTSSSYIGAVDFSSPAVVNGMVFVGSTNGSVYALNETTLEPIWNFATGGAVESSPAFANNTVFVGSSDYTIYALNASTNNTNGTQIWNYTTKGPVRSSPAVAYGKVFVSSGDGYVYALNQTNLRQEIWRFLVADPAWSSPAVVDGRVFVGVNDGRVYALNATTGKYLWHFQTQGAVVSSPAVANGVVFVGSNDTMVYALNATDGTQIWNSPTGGPVMSSPAVAVDKVFVGSNDNQIYALNVTDGSKIWNFTTGGPVVSSPAIFEGKVYVGSLDGNVYAFQANKPPQVFFDFYPTSPIVAQMVTFNASTSNDPDGIITSYTWSFGDGAVTETNQTATIHPYNMAGTYNVTLALRDNFEPVGMSMTWQLITVGEAWPMFRHDLTRIGNSTDVAPVSNITLWNQTIGSPDVSNYIYPSPAVVDDVVYMASPLSQGTVYALNATDGTQIWRKIPAPGHLIYGSPTFSGGLIFIGADSGYLYVLNATDGNIVQSFKLSQDVAIHSSPLVWGDRVFVGLQNQRVYALNMTDGSFLTSPDLGGAIDSSVSVAYGKVFVGSMNGSVYALDEATLKVVMWNYPTTGAVRSSPAVANNTVFIGSGDHNVTALDATYGTWIWNFTTNDDVRSSPAVAQGIVFVGSMDGNMYALNASTGKKKWNTTVGSVGWSSPAVAEGKVFVGSTNGTIYALYEESGYPAWSYQTNGSVDSSPAVLNDTLYVGSKDGNIYAFRSQVHEIKITNITPSSTIVVQNRTVDIGVTIWNRGTFDETNINVTAYYYNSTFMVSPQAIDSRIFNLTRGAQTVPQIDIPWNTTGVNAATYNVSADVTLVTPATYDYLIMNGTLEVVLEEANVSCDAVTPYKNMTGTNLKADGTKGDWTSLSDTNSLNISVTVSNHSEFRDELVTVTIYANATSVNYTTILIGPNSPKVVNLTWNTTDLSVRGNYILRADITLAPGETNTANNSFTYGWVNVSIVGDIRPPFGKVDMADLGYIARRFNTNATSPLWDPAADINQDGKVDMKDISLAAKNFGKSDS
jgi:outer membrane protein assembly factor BamB